MEWILKLLKQIKSWLLDIVFVETCLGCHKKGEPICDACIRKARRVERETDRDIFALFDYRDGVIKKAIWRLKYYNKTELGKKLGEFLYEEMIEEISDMRLYTSGSPILVIPVPISRIKDRSRGYNQSEIIARGFCEKSRKETLEFRSDIVKKKIDTKPQARIENRKERLKNIEGAFEVTKPEIAKGRTIIIIDDVTTTGGTINEITKVLKSSGAKKVVGMTLAH